MERPTKRQQRTVGAIVKVPLEDGYHTYSRILTDTFAFYDVRTKTDIADLKEIISKPILFNILVDNYAVTKGHWLKIGFLPLEENLKVSPRFYIQDAIHNDRFSILESDGFTIRPATRDECVGLERLASWYPELVEERVNDYYAGRYNFEVESTKNMEFFPKKDNKIVELQNFNDQVSYKQAV